jgi:GAF domain-containing protein
MPQYSYTDLEEKLARALRERDEALEQQTATAEVLRVISGSPTDVQPVLDVVVASAARLCEALDAIVFLRDGDFVVSRAHSGPLGLPFRQPQPLNRHWVTGRAVLELRTIHVPDLLHSDEYPEGRERALRRGHRATLVVPLLHEGMAIGAILVRRREARPFTDKQIELVQNFATQAVIAIENTRLLNELSQRTDDLTESLEQQTATSEILASLSGSMTDTKPVFDAIVRSLLRLFGTSFATVQLVQDGMMHLAAFDGERGFEKLAAHFPVPLDDSTVNGRAVLSKQTIQFAPLVGNPAAPQSTARFAGSFGYNSIISAPMLRENQVIGAVGTARRDPKPFGDKQVDLIKSFANQAVIAIENARLLNELRESLQQQTATADVLKVISRSTFDLQTVLNTLVVSAGRLCEAENVQLFLRAGEVYQLAAHNGFSLEYQEYAKQHPIAPGRGTLVARTSLEGAPVHIPDVLADPEYTWREGQRLAGFRAAFGVPLLREGSCIGVMAMTRATPRPFTERQMELVQTFADQAAIAIENVRLFEEIQDKSQQLAEASQHKSQFLANMSHELRTPLNAIIGVTEMLREDAEAAKQDTEPLDRVLGAGRHLLALINDILDLSKIEAGRMELHLETFSLVPVIKDVAKTIEPMATKKRQSDGHQLSGRPRHDPC